MNCFERRRQDRRSVNVRLGQLESVPDQLEPRLRVICNHDLDHVEPKENLRIIEHSQPGKAAACDAPSFFPIDRGDRAAKSFAAARLHFHEHERVGVPRDDIDFAATVAAKVTIKNFVALLAQEFPRQFLAERAAAQVRRSR